jgi:hypothetical protein
MRVSLLTVFITCCVAFNARQNNPFQQKLFATTTSKINQLNGVSDKLWTPSSWKQKPIKQPPNYPDEVSLFFCIIHGRCNSNYFPDRNQ